MNRHKHYKDHGDVIILYANNYINDIEGEKLEDTCDTLLEGGYRKIIIDFTETDIINSIGVSILIGIIEKVRDRKGTIYFSGLKKINFDIFSIVGLTKHVPIFETEEKALSVIRKDFSGHASL